MNISTFLPVCPMCLWGPCGTCNTFCPFSLKRCLWTVGEEFCMLPASKRPWSCRKERIKFQKNHPSYRTIIGAKDGEKTHIGSRPRPYGLMDFGALGLWGFGASWRRACDRGPLLSPLKITRNRRNFAKWRTLAENAVGGLGGREMAGLTTATVMDL